MESNANNNLNLYCAIIDMKDGKGFGAIYIASESRLLAMAKAKSLIPIGKSFLVNVKKMIYVEGVGEVFSKFHGVEVAISNWEHKWFYPIHDNNGKIFYLTDQGKWKTSDNKEFDNYKEARMHACRKGLILERVGDE